MRSSRWAEGLCMQRDILLARVEILQDQHERASQRVETLGGKYGAEASPLSGQVCGMQEGRSRYHDASPSGSESTPQHTACTKCGGKENGYVVAELRRRNRALDMEVFFFLCALCCVSVVSFRRAVGEVVVVISAPAT